ncbi:MAG TPA: hypothetical protein VE198_07695 [Actinoallomurus sp.]|nr:hypothetical protein [Actinoallomurus sp.]
MTDATTLKAARYQGRRLARTTIRMLAGGHAIDTDGNARATEAGRTPKTA